MTTTTHTGSPQRGPENYTTSAGLRALLARLHAAGPGAWARDPVAGELMQYAAQKYAALARKHSLDPWEAASAAFDVMRTRSAREAIDPWGVVTHAVRITCIAEERAAGLLCSVHQARRPTFSRFHDAERISDRENPLTDYRPEFQVTDPYPTDPVTLHYGGEATIRAYTSATSAVEDAIALFAMLGWPPDTARAAVEHVSSELARIGSRKSAFEALRRDKYSRALLDLSAWSWLSVIKTLLGHPNPAYAATSQGKGLLLRLVIGENLSMLLLDDDLVLTISVAAPSLRWRDGLA